MIGEVAGHDCIEPDGPSVTRRDVCPVHFSPHDPPLRTYTAFRR